VRARQKHACRKRLAGLSLNVLKHSTKFNNIQQQHSTKFNKIQQHSTKFKFLNFLGLANHFMRWHIIAGARENSNT
jgi:hypothetical protein